MTRLQSANDLESLKKEILAKKDPNKLCVTICSQTGCQAVLSEEVFRAFSEQIDRNGLRGKVDLRRTGCHGFCGRGPIVTVFPQNICYLGVKPDDVAEIISTTLVKNKVVSRLLYDAGDGRKIAQEDEIPFYKYQSRFVFANNRVIDAKNIDDYIAVGGYRALATVLSEMMPEQVIDEVKKASLRGRGGAGFPTGIKWETARNASGKIKYVIVNAEEGDPGAFMDRILLEGNPHGVLEGLIIGAYAIGAHQGFVYVRQEYPLAVENLMVALKQARKDGLLGRNILGSGFDFDVEVHCGAGAFVEGESSALMTSIEGRVGEPRPKYIRTAVSGIWERPSNLNNVKTWATVPFIINNGAGWFTSIGTSGSKGTMLFSLAGKVKNTGLIEVPMGMTLREIVFNIGGGTIDDKRLKAVQTGGPLGGVLPERLLDTPVDFDELSRLGSMMGSSGMIVMDEDNCMVNIARYFLSFLIDESCGKCVPCREGVFRMLEILNRICTGTGKLDDIKLLEEISGMVSGFSLCGLGAAAPNSVLSTLKYFRDEYEAHIEEKRCPAGVCKGALIS